MKLHAYVLAADPAWLEHSICSYYNVVDRIVVSYDQRGRGYTGKLIDVESCLQRLRELDPERKMVFSPGDYGRSAFTPMQNETHQRMQSLQEAGGGASWVLQIDTDEVLPSTPDLLAVLREAERQEIDAVEWPMRILFRRLRDGRYLEICGRAGEDRYEYPGPVAVRPTVTMYEGRRTYGNFIRPVVKGDCCSIQIQAQPSEGEIRLQGLAARSAIVHNSWAREAVNIRTKLSTWSHSHDQKSWLGFYLKWRMSPLFWKLMRDFHPFARGLWPALKISGPVPSDVHQEVL